MVWVNGSQSSGLVNFVPEARLPFCANQFHLPENGRERPNTGIKDGKTGLPFQMFRCSRNDPNIRVPFTLPPDFLGKFMEMI